MKEYRLTSWPELAPPYHSTAYRRIVSDLSSRFLSLTQLTERSGLKRSKVRKFVEMLDARHLLMARESLTPEAQFWSLRPLSGWLKRALSFHYSGRR